MKDSSLNANEADTRLRVVNGLGVVDARHSMVLHRLSKQLVYGLSIYQPAPPLPLSSFPAPHFASIIRFKVVYIRGEVILRSRIHARAISLSRYSINGRDSTLFNYSRAECTLF